MKEGIEATICVARGAVEQQSALDAWVAARIDPHACVVIVEGAFVEINPPPGVALERIAAGCVCCVGQVVLRVALTRLLRKRSPRHLLLMLSNLAAGDHAARVRSLLESGELGVSVAVT